MERVPGVRLNVCFCVPLPCVKHSPLSKTTAKGGEISYRNYFLHLLISVNTPSKKRPERQTRSLLDTRKDTQSRSKGKESEGHRENGVLNSPPAKKVSNRAHTSSDLQHRSKRRTASGVRF